MELDEFLFLEKAADEISISSCFLFCTEDLREGSAELQECRRLSSTPVKGVREEDSNTKFC